ncbi:polymorphic toxin-type HINT domain-containing protein [Actinomadura kijaniata]|uniref:polymorphic toxin-type HINT domain-containing protein n=1 Tax=Actinomadura kijaniata TaxID=46161 RepID=UPI000829927F|nr:polymorphic toxin-type HINT domain-containing protein [Actinomadura kijaniata]
MLRRLGDRGEGSLSYLAVIVLIGAVLAAVTVVVIPEKITAGISAGICRVTGDKNCEKPGGQNPRSQGATPSAQPTSVPPGQETPQQREYREALDALKKADQDADALEKEWNEFDLLKEIGKLGLDFLAGDIVNCIKKPNLSDCLWALLDIVPWGKIGKLLKSIPKIAKLIDRFLDLKRRLEKARDARKNAKKRADDAAESCRRANGKPNPGNSFVAGTPVLMADGTRRPIERVRVGDVVLAADPVTGLREPRRVTDHIVGEGKRDLARLTVDLDGELGGPVETVVVTEGHRFWVNGTDDWIPASGLVFGDVLTTPGSERAMVVRKTAHRRVARVHNLTVEGLHNYFVGVGGQEVLAHNCEGFDLDFNQVRDRISTHVMPLHGSGGSASGTKFASDIDENDIFERLLNNLSDRNRTGRVDQTEGHEHVFEWPGAGENGEGCVRVWMRPGGQLGTMHPIRCP